LVDEPPSKFENRDDNELPKLDAPLLDVLGTTFPLLLIVGAPVGNVPEYALGSSVLSNALVTEV
jgi:hypothetical protein